MSSAIREWVNLGVRWIHVFAGIMWVGQTYYFTWLDGQFGKLEKKVAANGKASAGWVVPRRGVFFGWQQKKPCGVPGKVRPVCCAALLCWPGGRGSSPPVFSLGGWRSQPRAAA